MHHRNCLAFLWAISAASILCAEVQPASEEPTPSAAPATQAGGPPAEHPMFQTSYTLSAGVAYQFATDTDPQTKPADGAGDFAITRYGVGLAVHYPVGNDHKWLLDHSLVAEHDDYNFGGTLAFSRDFGPVRRTVFTQEPWDATELVNYGLRATYLYDRDWSFFGGPIVGASFEDGADVGDSFSYGLVLGARYQVNKDFAVGVGAAAIRGISGRYSALPALILEWQINDSLVLRNNRSSPGLRGTTGVELAWTLGKVELCGGVAYERREFRLDDDGPAPDGIGRNTSIPAYLRLNYNPSQKLSFSLLGGYLLAGELQLQDDDGSRIGTTDYKAAPFISLGAAYRF